jgi:hypothetical protein
MSQVCSLKIDSVSLDALSTTELSEFCAICTTKIIKYFVDSLLHGALLDQLHANSYLVAAIKQLHKIKNSSVRTLNPVTMHVGNFNIAVITNDQPYEIVISLEPSSFDQLGSNMLIKFLAIIYKIICKNLRNRNITESDIFAIEKSEWYFEKVITHLQNVSFHVRDGKLYDAIKANSIISSFSVQITIEKGRETNDDKSNKSMFPYYQKDHQ